MGFENYDFDPETDGREVHADFAAIGDSVNEDKIKQSVLKRLFKSARKPGTTGDHMVRCES